jgi:acyl carrier protein
MTDPNPRSSLDLPEQITALIARSKNLDPSVVHLSSTFDELQIDSLDKINLTFEIEEIYAIQIPDDSLNELRTVGDVVAGVQRLMAEKTQTHIQTQP